MYSLVSHAEWGAVTLRPHEQHNVPEGKSRVLPWKAPVSALWVYRFATARVEVDQLEPWQPHAWFANVRTDLDTPPSPRRARPARELPSLTGRRLHARVSGVIHGHDVPVGVDDETRPHVPHGPAGCCCPSKNRRN